MVVRSESASVTIPSPYTPCLCIALREELALLPPCAIQILEFHRWGQAVSNASPNRFTGGSRFPPAAPTPAHFELYRPLLVQRFVWGFFTLLCDKKGCKGPPCSQVMRIPQENRKLINRLMIPKSALSVQFELAKAGWPALRYLIYYVLFRLGLAPPTTYRERRREVFGRVPT